MGTDATAFTGGSSPLARGLLIHDRSFAFSGGIIPARAGFTPPRPRRAPPRGDHPRSRGVYRGRQGSSEGVSGSSPLARGLRPGRGASTIIPWIIPARAGFTRWTVTPAGSLWDHPRSRGVYTGSSMNRAVASGSSPLARGLLRPGRRMRARPGIIPARAGFTLADPWNPNEPVLYQTPAAFTADPGPAPPSCGSAVVVPRWTTTPSGA